MHKLKPNVPDFEVVDGPFSGRKYKAGEAYNEVPENEKHKFIATEDTETTEEP